MDLTRLRYLVSPDRYRLCRRLFSSPIPAQLRLAFLTKGAFRLTHRGGHSLAFSRRGGDHRFWDWFLGGGGHDLQFTPDGELLLDYDGLRVVLRPGSQDFFVFDEIFLGDSYNLGGLPRALDTVIDLGGNVGLFTLALLRRSRRVVTVEALERNWRQAEKNIVGNGGEPSDLFRFAVTDRSGTTAVLHDGGHRTGMNSLFGSWADASRKSAGERVPTISLPDLLERAGVGEIDLLKCDVEGAEYAILLSTPPPVLRRIRHLLLEVHFVDDETKPIEKGETR